MVRSRDAVFLENEFSVVKTDNWLLIGNKEAELESQVTFPEAVVI